MTILAIIAAAFWDVGFSRFTNCWWGLILRWCMQIRFTDLGGHCSPKFSLQGPTAYVPYSIFSSSFWAGTDASLAH